jgi:hypothetical protein
MLNLTLGLCIGFLCIALFYKGFYLSNQSYSIIELSIDGAYMCLSITYLMAYFLAKDTCCVNTKSTLYLMSSMNCYLACFFLTFSFLNKANIKIPLWLRVSIVIPYFVLFVLCSRNSLAFDKSIITSWDYFTTFELILTSGNNYLCLLYFLATISIVGIIIWTQNYDLIEKILMSLGLCLSIFYLTEPTQKTYLVLSLGLVLFTIVNVSSFIKDFIKYYKLNHKKALQN